MSIINHPQLKRKLAEIDKQLLLLKQTDERLSKEFTLRVAYQDAINLDYEARLTDGDENL